MNITTLNRTLVETNLQVLRLPLTAAEKLAGKTDAVAWPPTVAFETFEAQVKTIVGSLWKDEQLVEDGRTIKAKIAQLAEAERLEAKAEAQRAAADAELRETREAAARQREDAEQRAEARERQLEQEKEAKKRQAAAETSQRKTAAAKADDLRERVLTTQERAAQRRTMQTEAEALDERTEALSAEEQAANIDRTLQARKARRKAV